MAVDSGSRRYSITMVVPAALLAYGVTSLLVGHRWIGSVGAAVVAWLLWRQHPRARFAAYIFLSAVALRSLVTGSWPILAFAVGVLVVLQTRSARRHWPRLAWGWPRSLRGPAGEAGDRMTPP